MAREDPIGLPVIDAALAETRPTVDSFVRAASEYVRSSRDLGTSLAKKAQLRLSYILGRVIAADLAERLDGLDARVGETKVGGGLRSVNADVAEYHKTDGLRLAIEIKPINLAVGRAIWNRFGDIRTFAVNVHLKFPFAVVGGVLTLPTYEETAKKDGTISRKSTVHLIERATERLARSGNRETEGDAAHLLEAIGLVIYDPDSQELDPDHPPAGSSLRWEEFIDRLATAYAGRFEGSD